jgi:catechol 2,3-dioxygenase-like lactoylglutathione lyase family enzyme
MKNLIKGPDHMAFKVKNLEAMVNFYHAILGMELVKAEEYKAGKFPFLSVRAGSTLIDLMPSKEAAKEEDSLEEGRQRLNHFCLRLEDSINLSELKTYLQENKVVITAEATNNFGAFGNGPSIYVKDPEDNTVELKLYP